MNPQPNIRILEDARQQMNGFLGQLATASPSEQARLAKDLHPQPADYASVFLPAAAPTMQAHFERLFAQDPVPRPKPGQDQVRLSVALAGMLRERSPISQPFPGGYQRVAPFLMPLVPWATWSFHSGDPTRGMRFDGLVAIEDRLIWLPRPYRLLKRN
ncbi:MAG: hypothetical protein AB8H79_23430 [Myxococcota bacterium]